MGWPLLTLVACIYVFVGWTYIGQHRYGMALCFIAYALANLGFIVDLLEHR